VNFKFSIIFKTDLRTFANNYAAMDFVFEKEWQEVVKEVSHSFGESLDYTGILFIIGLQELGHDFQTFKKDQKLEIIHIGLCSVLIHEGYYSFIGRDEDGWPHFERTLHLPALTPEEQERLVKRSIIRYFRPNSSV
jgi:hypothetical protein